MNRGQIFTLVSLGAITAGAIAAAASENWLAVAWAIIAGLWCVTTFAVTRILADAQAARRQILKDWIAYQAGENAFTRRAKQRQAAE